MQEITGLTTSWLAARTGVQPAQIEARRRSGELLGVRREDGEVVYPSWQFDRDCKPLPLLSTLIAAATRAGLDERRLHELVVRRSGLLGNQRVADLLRGPAAASVVQRLVWRAA